MPREISPPPLPSSPNVPTSSDTLGATFVTVEKLLREDGSPPAGKASVEHSEPRRAEHKIQREAGTRRHLAAFTTKGRGRQNVRCRDVAREGTRAARTRERSERSPAREHAAHAGERLR